MYFEKLGYNIVSEEKKFKKKLDSLPAFIRPFLLTYKSSKNIIKKLKTNSLEYLNRKPVPVNLDVLKINYPTTKRNFHKHLILSSLNEREYAKLENRIEDSLNYVEFLDKKLTNEYESIFEEKYTSKTDPSNDLHSQQLATRKLISIYTKLSSDNQNIQTALTNLLVFSAYNHAKDSFKDNKQFVESTAVTSIATSKFNLYKAFIWNYFTIRYGQDNPSKIMEKSDTWDMYPLESRKKDYKSIIKFLKYV